MVSKIFYSLVLIINFYTIQAQTTKEIAWQHMATEVDLWTDGLGMPIDPEIKKTIIILNLLGFKTKQSCEGHLDHGCSYPWIRFAVDTNPVLMQQLNELQDIKDQKIFEIISKKYPNISWSEINQPDDSVLATIFNQIDTLYDQLDKSSNENLAKLHDLIKEFYRNHNVDHDRVLILKSSINAHDELVNLGSSWQKSRNENLKKQKLQEYQEEMELFTQFLIDYYFNHS